MDNHNLIFKLSRLLPSSFTSCQFTTLPDVAQNTILHENHLKSPNPKKNLPISSPLPKICSSSIISPNSSNAKGRKCPPKIEKVKNKNPLFSVNHSSSSNSAWFTSGDDFDTDTFFSISSNSGDSFRLKSGRILKKCEEMKSIDETGRRSHSSYDAVLTKSSRANAAVKIWPEIELGSDRNSTQMYYGGSNPSLRRRKPKNRGSRRSLDYRSVIGESYAVEKRSSDPGGDFRASMVEMILQKQIFAAEDLERLLLCFLSLNAVKYHGIIFNVFSEICHTLFSN